MQNISEWVLIARLVERGLIVGVVVISMMILIFVMRRKIQAIDLDLSTSAGTVKTSLSFTMPVFIFLIFIGFSYIVLTHPVTFQVEFSGVSSDENKTGEILSGDVTSDKVIFVGLDSSQDSTLETILTINTIERVWRDLEGQPDEEELVNVRESLSLAYTKLSSLRFELLSELFPPELRTRCAEDSSKPLASEVSPECLNLWTALRGELE